MRFRSGWLLNPGKVFPQLHRCAELGRLHVHAGRPPVPGSAAFLKQLGAMSRFAPADLDELRVLSARRSPSKSPSKWSPADRSVGSAVPSRLPRLLDLSRLAGIRDYQPSELV